MKDAIPFIVNFAAFAFIFGGFALLIGGAYWLRNQARQQRTKKLKAVADERGLEFSATDDASLKRYLADLHLFQHGHTRRLTNIFHIKTEDAMVHLFDYSYRVLGSRYPQQQTVICFRSSRLNLPDFVIRPENSFDKLSATLGFQDIDFPSHPEFSEKYLLRGTDEESVRDLFCDDVLEFFEQFGRFRMPIVEGHRNRLILHVVKLIRPQEIRDFMKEGFKIYQVFRPADPPIG